MVRAGSVWLNEGLGGSVDSPCSFFSPGLSLLFEAGKGASVELAAKAP